MNEWENYDRMRARLDAMNEVRNLVVVRLVLFLF